MSTANLSRLHPTSFTVIIQNTYPNWFLIEPAGF